MEETTQSKLKIRKMNLILKKRHFISKMLQELCNLAKDGKIFWKLLKMRCYQMVLKKFIQMDIRKSDDIEIPEEECKHSLYSERSHFYRSFDRKEVILKKTLFLFGDQRLFC